MPPAENVEFRCVTAETVREICRLSDTLAPAQRRMVADNAVSIAQAHFCEQAWFRAIYAGDTPVGFLMLHEAPAGAAPVEAAPDGAAPVEAAPSGADVGAIAPPPEVFLWRFMIAGPHQGKGYGRRALTLLVEQLKARGIHELGASCGTGEASPEPFYRRLGFERTGEMHGDEIGLVLRF